MTLVVMNLPSSAGDLRDVGLIPESGRSPGGGHATHFSILAWRIPWTEEPARLQSLRLQRVRHDQSDLAQHVIIHMALAEPQRPWWVLF